MGADILIAAIAVPADRDRPLDFDAGRRLLETVTHAGDFCLDDPESVLENLERVQDSRGPVWMTHQARPGGWAMNKRVRTRSGRALASAGTKRPSSSNA